ncbi:MAG: DUF2254 domain-containing protein [Vibrio sp.]
MAFGVSRDHFRFLLNRLKDKLWVKPLWMCLCSILAVAVAKMADYIDIEAFIYPISRDSIFALLEIMASSMLMIATFSVGSMVSAYASASTSATPRAFSVIVADDVSKNALSRFIGSFIFSIVSLTALHNELFQSASLFVLFILTCVVFALVILTFIRWVDRLARLGRVGSTIDSIEKVAMNALQKRKCSPTLAGASVQGNEKGEPVLATKVGYVQHIDMSCLQQWAETNDVELLVASLPGDFVAPGRVLAYILTNKSADDQEFELDNLITSFEIGQDRLFDDDPRFGMVVLSEIASKALSPGINDPGSSIKVITSLVRLFASWCEPVDESDMTEISYDRVRVPKLEIADLCNDAFRPIARDGAGCIEVVIQLQKSFSALYRIGDEPMKDAVKTHAQMSLKRSQLAFDLEEDLDVVRQASLFAKNLN